MMKQMTLTRATRSDAPDVIDRFRGKYNFLSNFYVVPRLVRVGAVLYPSVEHAYQAYKAKNQVDHDMIRFADTPSQAKKFGRQIPIRPDWDDCKIWVMLTCLIEKFRHLDLRQELLATGDAYLIEGNHWGDRYWGVCADEGQNWLGQLLMHVRWLAREGYYDTH